MAHMPFLLIAFTVQTVFLFAALWIMIKLQKLNYNFFGLVGSAALSCAIDILVSHFLGWSFAALASVPILIFCISKVTRADHTDVVFTIAVGYALTFGMDLWLMGMLMGDLRVSAKSSHDSDAAVTEVTNHVSLSEAELAAVAAKAKEAQLQKSAQEMTGKLTLKGVTQGKTPLAMISSGAKTYMVTVGESFVIGDVGTNAVVTCKSIEDRKVIVEVNGRTNELTLPR